MLWNKQPIFGRSKPISALVGHASLFRTQHLRQCDKPGGRCSWFDDVIGRRINHTLWPYINIFNFRAIHKPHLS